ncbi:unnamed protein product [Schistocephalus solidus]|uniref:Reverse transcriptase domain-containing protein n=1 Tax=Schistocephalus solidus TaxID=70667 RepID=A0A3P7BNA6_SCHSO|nr:unnamed protein product [Schistocephalus solidus]
MREMQGAWMTRKAEEIQGFTDRNEWKNFFAATKAVYRPPIKGAAPLLSVNDRALLTEKTQIPKRSVEPFQSVLNQPSTISDVAIGRLPEVEINANLDLPPSLQETIRAVQKLSSGKAPGLDAIPAEIYKNGRPQMMNQLTTTPSAPCMCCVCRVADKWTGSKTAMAPPYLVSKCVMGPGRAVAREDGYADPSANAPTPATDRLGQ